jgi:DNA-binding LytR/AlgR family response regulator
VYARELLTKKNPDVLILDIQLGEHESGLDILESNPNFETIIATGYADLGIQSLKYNIAGVFFKTDSIASLATLLYKTKKVQAIKSIDEESAYLTLPKGRKINVNRIESVVAAGNYATIHYHRSTDPGAFLYATYFENLTTVLQELPEHFCRCHSSWILNPFWIVQIHTRQDEHGRDTVALMFDGTIIPIARDRKKDVFEHCKKYNPRLIK